MKHAIKKIILFFIAGTLMITSCNKNDSITPDRKSEPEKMFVFNFKSSNIKEFQKITSENVMNLVKEEVKDFFGNRLDFIIPTEIKVKDDSLYIKKMYGIKEKYAARWHKDELFLYNQSVDSWVYCGKLNGMNRFFLNIGLFTKLSPKDKSTLYFSGQDYSLNSHDKIRMALNDTVIWLKLEVVLEKE